jgi:hypothetical protein
MADLQCLPPSVEPGVSDHIDQIINMIKQVRTFALCNLCILCRACSFYAYAIHLYSLMPTKENNYGYLYRLDSGFSPRLVGALTLVRIDEVLCDSCTPSGLYLLMLLSSNLS